MIDVKPSARLKPAGVGPLSMAGLAILLLCGCGGSGNKLGRLPISGTVTLDGVPLKAGHIVFEPIAGQPTQSGGMIYDGKFEVPEAKGAAPGKYSVAIFSSEPSPTTKFEPGTPEHQAEVMKLKSSAKHVPRKYNFETELTAEVKVDADNFFPFELVSTTK